MFLVSMVLNFFTIDSVNNATDALFPTLTVVAYFLKLLNFNFNADGMQRIYEDITNLRLENDTEVQSINEELRFLYKISVCFMTIAHVAMILAFVRALFINDPPELPLPCWYPIDWKNVDLYYWIAYSYQMIGTFLVLNVNATLDLYSIFLMASISKHMEILGNRLANLTIQFDIKTINNPTEQTRITEKLIECIKVHKNIIR